MISLVSTAATAAEIGAIGELSPRGGVLHVTGASDATIKQIVVKPFDTVSRDDILMYLDNHEVMKAQWELAKIETDEIEKTAGDKINLQKANVDSVRLQLKHAKESLAEYKALGPNASAKSEVTKRQNLVEETAIKLRIETIKLRQIKKQVSTQRAKAKLNLQISEARYGKSIVVAPHDGTILEIRRREGDRLGGDAVILMADLSEMHVICEVFEGDLLKLKEGMKATATSKSLTEPLEGVVHRIGRIVDTERKLATVVVRLLKAKDAGRFIGMEVQVKFQL